MGSYSVKHNAYVSHLSARQYAFTKDRTGVSRRRALAKLQADDKAFEQARATHSDAPPPAKTHADKVAEVIHAERPQTTVADGIGSRVAMLERQLSHTRNPGDRASISRKIAALSSRQAVEIEKQEQREAHQAFLESPEWIKANADAFELAETLALSQDKELPQQLCKDAIASKLALQRQPSPEGIAAYREREKKLRDDYAAGKVRSIEITKAKIAQNKLDISRILLDAQPVLPSEQMDDKPKASDLYTSTAE